MIQKRVIVFSTAFFPLVGGAEVALKEIMARLTSIHFDVVCAKIQPGLKSTEQFAENVTIHRVGVGSKVDKFLLPFLGSIRAARLEGSHDAVIWSLMASFGGFAALVYCAFRRNAKMLLTLQEGDPLEHYAKRAGAFRFLHKMIFRRANAVQAISTFLAKWATEMGFNGTPVVVPNGVDVELFANKTDYLSRRKELRDAWKIADDDVVLVTTSRLSLKNGVDDLIASLTFLLDAKYKLVIAGEGEDRDKLLNLVDQKRLQDRVIFLGKKEHRELPSILQASDVFIRPSLSEGLGNSFLEAMAAGIPIIGTRVGGIPDFLEDGKTGVFCEVRNPESIATAVKRIQEDVGLKERLVREGSILVAERFEWNGIAERMGQLLTSL